MGSPHEPEKSVRVIGRYALYGEIASGGMATVHFGRLLGPVGFSRTVAIKRLHPQYAKDPEFVSMFLDEARLAARIRHPHVVPTLDVVATQGELFLVMDYVQGESLSRLVRAVRAQDGLIRPGIVAAIVSGVLHGLHAAHEAKNERGEPLGIVHRDVSPQNVLVGVDGVARVLDFGVAKAGGRVQTTREGQIKGKLAYMPPEQLRGGAVSRATDIYAAAVVLWETLTSQRLFAGDNEGTILAKILEAQVEPPSRYAPGLPPALDAVTLRGLARDPAQRFATAREMALALEKCMPLAPPSEVGEWVEQTAGQVLVMRAKNIAEIESSSSVQGIPSAPLSDAPPGLESVSDPSGRSVPKVAVPTPGIPVHVDLASSSQLSSISVAKSDLVPPLEPPARRRTGLFLVLGAVLVATVLLGSVRALRSRPGPAAPPPPAAEPSALAPPAPLPPPSPPVVRPAPSEATAPSASAAPPAAAVKPKRPPPRTGSGPSPGGGCDPPYTVDAEGHKHYKLNCL